MRTEARFPAVPRGDAHYESFYLKAAAPEGGRAIWIRHTVHKRPGEEPTCAVWMTYFDAPAGAPRAAKAQFGAAELSTPDGAYIRVDGSEIGPGSARGALEAAGVAARWGLRFTDRHEPLRHLPSEWMYRRSLPRTKLLSPHPGALFDGSFEIDGERVDLTAWPGMVGHNWGSEHADSWVWIHATFPESGGEADFLDIAAARVRVGPLRSPWIANGAIVIDGERFTLGGLANSRRTRMDALPTECAFTVPGPEVTVNGTVGAPAGRFVAWVYSDPRPGGGEHHALNCSISDLEVLVERPDGTHAHRRAAAGAVYELGTHDVDHGIDVQPFPDG